MYGLSMASLEDSLIENCTVQLSLNDNLLCSKFLFSGTYVICPSLPTRITKHRNDGQI